MKIINLSVWIIGILIIRKAAWRCISRRMQYFLWILPVLFLIIAPFLDVTSKFSSENFLHSVRQQVFDMEKNSRHKAEENTTISVEKKVVIEDAQIVDKEAPMPETLVDNKNDGSLCREKWIELIKAVKYVVIISMLCIMCYANMRLWVWCKKNRTFYKKDNTTKMNVYVLDGISSPFLFGKSIYITTDILENERYLRHVILHEYCHFRHMDNLWVIVRNICLSFNWYNPLAWLAIEYVKRDCELACDEAVLDMLEEGERKDYGYTLLAILKKQKRRRTYLVNTTSMSENVKKMTERITLIASGGRRSLIVTCMTIICIVLLTGFTFTQMEKEETLLNDAVHAEQEEIIESNVKELSDITNKDESDMYLNSDKVFYNTVKYYDGYFYYAGVDKMHRINYALSDKEELIEGRVRLGNCEDEYIYYIKYPSDKISDSGLLRLNVKNKQEELLVEWVDEMWLYSNLYVHNGVLYIEKGEICTAYEINDEMRKVDETDNIIYQKLEECGLSGRDINNLEPGYLNAFFNMNVFIYMDRDNKEIVIYDTNTNKAITKLEECESDVLISDIGLVYKRDADIYLKRWYEDKTTLLYDAKPNEFINYGTYDKKYVYVFSENENKVKCIKISWEGEIEDYKYFDFTKLAINLELSASNGVVSYRQNENIIFEKTY